METNLAYRSDQAAGSSVALAAANVSELFRVSVALAFSAVISVMIALPLWGESIAYRGLLPTLADNLLVWLQRRR